MRLTSDPSDKGPAVVESDQPRRANLFTRVVEEPIAANINLAMLNQLAIE